MDRRTRYGTPPGLQAEVSDMRGLYPRFVRVSLPGDLPVQPQYHETLESNSGLLEGTLHLSSPTIDRVDAVRPEATWLYSRHRIVQRIEPNLRHRREHAGLPSVRFDLPSVSLFWTFAGAPSMLSLAMFEHVGKFTLDKESPIQGQEPEASRFRSGAGSRRKRPPVSLAFARRNGLPPIGLIHLNGHHEASLMMAEKPLHRCLSYRLQ